MKPFLKKLRSLLPTAQTAPWMTPGRLALIIIIGVVLIDQVVKFYVKTHFYLFETVDVFSWFKIRFIQNPGMAFGMQLGSKLFLTLFRIVVVALLIYYLAKLVKRRSCFPRGYVACISLIIAGAAGNIIDCVFYGLIFNNPLPPMVASLVPFGHGYGTVLHGEVVDMLYFPLCSFDWPSWMPFVGGQHFTFFDPVFNIADSAITIGMIALILFYSKYLGSFEKVEKECQKDSDESTRQ